MDLILHPHPHPRPWHKGSVFGDGPRRPLPPNLRRIWLDRAEYEHRQRNLTHCGLAVARKLVFHLGADGRLDPSHQTIAKWVGCSERSVRRALVALRLCRLIEWQPRIERRPWPAGGRGAQRAEQTSNAYRLLIPAKPAAPWRKQARAEKALDRQIVSVICGGQIGRENRTVSNFKSPPPSSPPLNQPDQQAALAAQAALTRIAEERQAARVAEYHLGRR